MNSVNKTSKNQRLCLTKLFIRLFALVQVFNFGSLVNQVRRFFCADGLIPIGEYIPRVTKNSYGFFDSLVDCPSLFLFLHNDWFIIALAWLGLAIAFMVLAGFYTRWGFIALFPVYISFVSVGQQLYSFQWDSLILETTFLAILLPSSGLFFKNWNRGADKVTSFLFLWLLFRLYIESGVAKLFWGPDSWASLEAMSHYYETAPIPTWIGYYAHFLPEWWHQMETLVTLIFEILLSALIFGKAWMRRVAFVVFTIFQFSIIATANYGVFNYTTLCLQLFLLTDRDLQFIFRFLPFMKSKPFLQELKHQTKGIKYVIATIVVIFSVIEFSMLVGGRGVHQTVIGKVQKYTGATRITSRYHLFGPIDPIRYELIIEVTQDGTNWTELLLPFKAEKLVDKPPFVAPYHPRLDFRLWFERYPVSWGDQKVKPFPEASVHPKVLQGYLNRLVTQLIKEPEKAAVHFNHFPLKDGGRFKEVRISYYHFNMTQNRKKNGSKQYWTKRKVGTVYIDLSLGKNGGKVIVQGRTTQ